MKTTSIVVTAAIRKEGIEDGQVVKYDVLRTVIVRTNPVFSQEIKTFLRANKRSYLQDSFRSNLLAPTMMGIKKELKANHRNDFNVEALLVAGLLVDMDVSIYLLIKTKYLMRRIRNN